MMMKRRRSAFERLCLLSFLFIFLSHELCIHFHFVSAEAAPEDGLKEVSAAASVETGSATGTDEAAAAAAAATTKEKHEEQKKEEPGSSEEESEYLYEEDDAYPVIDYKSDAEDKMHPDFLFSENNGPRMVEFYAWWCPHCRHFRDHFVQLTRQITTIARDQGANVKVYGVSCTVFRDICKHYEIDAYPQIRLFPANTTNISASLNYWNVHPFDVVNKLGIQVKDMEFIEHEPEGGDVKLRIRKGRPTLGQIGIGGGGGGGIGAAGLEATPELYKRTKKDLFSDAYLSFQFALKNGVYMTNGPLTNSTRDSLHSWLFLLEKAMPPTWHIHNLIRALLQEFDAISQSEDALIAVVDRFPPRSKKWSRACSHGEKGAGYTCGLWELFHIMTVGVVEWNLMIYEGEEMMLDISEAALILRNYVENFFGCEVCRVNFVGAYDTCAHDRCNRLHEDADSRTEWMQLPLWLFETHNAVNVRLLKERSERENWPNPVTREDEIRKEWPAREDCPKCWREDGGWDEKTVYRYMRIEYWPEDTITSIYRKEMNPQTDDDRVSMPLPHMLIQLIPIVLVLGMAVTWYLKKLERTRSGLHKRLD